MFFPYRCPQARGRVPQTPVVERGQRNGPLGGVQPPRRPRKGAGPRMQRPCRGGVTDTVVALGSAASGLARRASSATRKKASRAGGVGGAPHLPSARHWGMRCVAQASVEESPALGGNQSRGRQCHGEQEGESILLGRDDSRVGMSRRRVCGCVGRCKPSAGPTRRQRGGPDSARAEPARACEAAASEYLPSRTGGNARERPQRPVRRSRSTAQAGLRWTGVGLHGGKM